MINNTGSNENTILDTNRLIVLAADLVPSAAQYMEDYYPTVRDALQKTESTPFEAWLGGIGMDIAGWTVEGITGFNLNYVDPTHDMETYRRYINSKY